jgi:radical SAM-linked protein
VPRQKLRFRFAIEGPLRFLSHLETLRVFTRALRRAQLPVQYSQGFHPQPQLAFATALPVGTESTGEYADVVLHACLEPRHVQERLNAVLPQHMRVLDARTVPLKAPALMSERLVAQYTVDVPQCLLPVNNVPLPERVQALLTCSHVPVQRWHKKGPRQVNIRPGIASLEVRLACGNTTTFAMLLHEEETLKTKPQEVIQALLGLDATQLCALRIYKHEAFVYEEGRLVSLMHHQPHAAQAREVCV